MDDRETQRLDDDDGAGAHLGRALVYSDEIPFEWSRLEDEPSPGRLATIHEGNERLLRHLASLDDHHHETDEEDLAGLGPGLARLEFKINILLEMVSHVLASQMSLPPRAAVRLGSETLVWSRQTDGEWPAPGQRIMARLFINEQYPHPLQLPGVVERVDTVGDEVEMRYDPLPESLRDRLERMIFRRHRRLISQRHRQGRGAG